MNPKSDNPWMLTGKTILVTGGTMGIGEAIVSECANLGAHVLVVARNENRLNEKLESWKQSGFSVLGIATDISQPDGIQPVLKKVEDEFGMLDGLVNNVGTNIRKKSIEYSDEELQFLFRTNLDSSFHLSRLAFPFLVRSTAPSVVNVASVGGMTALRSGAPYAMTKAAMIQMTKNLAVEWGKSGVRVNAVSPWYTRTPLASPVLSNPPVYQEILDRTPLGRIAEPEEVARTVAFCLMPASSFMTGHCLVVDGGFLAYGF